MLLIRVSAEDERLIRRATTMPELEGIKTQIVELIDRAKVLKSFGKVAVLKTPAFGWRDAIAIFDEVCGAHQVTHPPYPDATWYARMNAAIRRHGMTPDSLRQLAEYARDNLRMPSSMDFLLNQQVRIFAGEFDVRKPTPLDALQLPRE